MDRHIARVYVWQNGMAMVFDQDGEQMPEFQGPYVEVKDKIDEARGTVSVQHKIWPGAITTE